MSSPHASPSSPPKDNGDNAQAAMSAAVQGAQSAYTAAYSTLVHVSQHLQQGLQETQAVIGKVLQSSMRIASEINSTPSGVRLTAKISNIGPVPLPNARCHLSFEPPPKHQRQIAEDEIAWTFVSGYVMNEGGNGEGEGSTIPSLFDTPLTLQPSTQYIQVVDIKSKAPMQYNGILEINFSAMDEQPIQEKHQFGIYLLDQMQKLRVAETQMDVMTHRHYWHSFLQHILGIELDLGKDVVYVSLQPYQQGYEKHRIICKIQPNDKEEELAKVMFGADTADAIELLQPLVQELDMLHDGGGD